MKNTPLPAYCYRCIIEVNTSARGVSVLSKLWALITSLNAREVTSLDGLGAHREDLKTLMKEIEKIPFVIQQNLPFLDFPNPVKFSVKKRKGNNLKATFMNLPLEFVWKIRYLLDRPVTSPASPKVKYSLRSQQMSFFIEHQHYQDLFVALQESGAATGRIEGGNMLIIPVNITYQGRNYALKPKIMMVRKEDQMVGRLDFTLGHLVETNEFPPPATVQDCSPYLHNGGKIIHPECAVLSNASWLDQFSPLLTEVHSSIVEGMSIWMEGHGVSPPRFMNTLRSIKVKLMSRY